MQHIRDYRNENTKKNEKGDPLSWVEAHNRLAYVNLLYTFVGTDGDELPVPLREATKDEVIRAFNNTFINEECYFIENPIDVNIGGISTECYVYSAALDAWHEDRLVTDTLKVNDGEITYYCHELSAYDADYDPNVDQEFFERNYDGDVNGEVRAVLTNLVSNKEYVWSFTPN